MVEFDEFDAAPFGCVFVVPITPEPEDELGLSTLYDADGGMPPTQGTESNVSTQTSIRLLRFGN